ncbi:tetratricopeptide repeat protein [Kribbella sandramycini]|uniref:Tetratricopeptide (TPR) repeat protein n=1 Tax=Kribbella sandramycini TaxID=60450 RepID=A0A7Y4L3Z7_9ACTN|nr:tetratricopeptide repeat protein [Kribbella sandramycini]MBB6566321.1 tetratricopeptide (TPR) repeat protein [Kribbella sandramycini]NOL43017.1 tetratricopeptide repeat protein [Kribbella sandramycini]
MTPITVRPVYARTTQSMPVATERPLPPHNRLAVHWGPLLDLGPAPMAPVRLRLLQPVAEWLADDSGPWSWCSRISLPGIRHQVVVHAGLPSYAAGSPSALAVELRSPAWQQLLAALDRFAELDWRRRSLVAFQLAQLSYHRIALRLAAPDAPEHFRYELARIAASTPGEGARALQTFQELATGASEPLLRVGAAFQGIGHSLRDRRGPGTARWFELRGQETLSAVPAVDWVSTLIRSRFHRAVALLRLTEQDRPAAQAEAGQAAEFHEQLVAWSKDSAAELIAAENRRYLLQLELQLVSPTDIPAIEALCAELAEVDPYCVETRTTIGDSWLAAGETARAAAWYERAGQLGTGAGAVAWYRAGQCHEALGDPAAALNAMGRCLELDPSAVEPRAALAATYR